jgi:ATP-dependent Zn protease
LGNGFCLEVEVNPNRSRSTIIYVLLFAAIIILAFYSFNQNTSTQETLSINQLAADIQSGKVSRIIEEENRLTVIYGSGTSAIERISHKEAETTVVQQLLDLGVSAEMLGADRINISFIHPVRGRIALPFIYSFIILRGFSGRLQAGAGSNNAAMSFDNRARMFTGDQP